jgi:hypothetical protein
MFNSGILDVAIGIVFIYLLVSLIVTAVNELIAAIFKMRGRVLWQGLCTLLPSGTKKENMAEEIYRHPLIAGLSHGGRPSYIPSRTFALALLDVISGGTGHIAKLKQLEDRIELLSANLSRSLNLLLHESQGDLEKFRANIETWFNDSMDRVSGVYKRKVQYALFFLAFLLAAFLNIDTIVLANRLSHDSALRAALVASATSAANQPAPQGESGAATTVPQQEAALATTIRELDQLSLPIGWQGPGADLTLPVLSAAGLWDCSERHIVGWVLTAFAATLGAPFWFDLLNRFVNIRSAGRVPDEKPDGLKGMPSQAESAGSDATAQSSGSA